MTSGGAATNAGIDFQSRVGALALVSMLGSTVDLRALGLGDSGDIPISVSFETNDGIDDVVISTHSHRILIQAKNSISLSSAADSEMASVARQVVDAHLRSSGTDKLFLVTSPRASARIRFELRKICIAHRANSSTQNFPFNNSENHTLSVLRSHIEREFTRATGDNLEYVQFSRIVRSIYVEVADVGDNSVGERLAIIALAPITLGDPRLLWQSLVSTSLSLARDRLSIDAAGLTERFRSALKDRTNELAPKATPALDLRGSVSMGKEVILAQNEESRVIVTEIRRFDEGGQRRVTFIGDKIDFGGQVQWKILRRTATLVGMERELDEGLIPENSGVAVLQTDLGNLEDSAAVKAHASAFIKRIESNHDFLQCLVCGRHISEHRSHLVEIDSEDQPYQAGMVHRSCLRPTFRIVGFISNDLFAKHARLWDFDFGKWLHSLRTGQGLVNSVRELGSQPIQNVAWNFENGGGTVGGWGISYRLEDGSTRLVLVRGRVHRFSKQAAIEGADRLRSGLEESATSGDPIVGGDFGYGPYSAIVSARHPNPSRVVAVDPVEISKETVQAYSTVENYYAPLFFLRSLSDDSIYSIDGTLILLSDPLRLNHFVSNWDIAGFSVPECSTEIISDDTEFDNLMLRTTRKQQNIVVDPLFDSNGVLMAGLLVSDMQQMIIESMGTESSS